MVTSFEPPRAGRAAGLWRSWYALRRSMLARQGGRFVLPGLSPRQHLIAVFFVPLLGMHLLANRLLIRVAGPMAALAFLVSLVACGQPAGAIAFGLLIALHAIGITSYLDATSPLPSLRGRSLRRIAVTGLAMILLPLMASRAFSLVVIRMDTDSGTLLINPLDTAPPLRPGERVAYRLASSEGHSGHTWVIIKSGIYLGQVLALPGETVSFGPGVYVVNGVSRPALPLMPDKGKLQIAAGQVAIWPANARINGRISLPAETALLSESALAGRPYTRWFWRTQTP